MARGGEEKAFTQEGKSSKEVPQKKPDQKKKGRNDPKSTCSGKRGKSRRVSPRISPGERGRPREQTPRGTSQLLQEEKTAFVIEKWKPSLT